MSTKHEQFFRTKYRKYSGTYLITVTPINPKQLKPTESQGKQSTSSKICHNTSDDMSLYQETRLMMK